MEPAWRKSKLSVNSGACIEVAWRKATRCDGGTQGECVEVAFPGEVWVRDSKSPERGHIAVTADAWQEFTDTIRAGALG